MDFLVWTLSFDNRHLFGINLPPMMSWLAAGLTNLAFLYLNFSSLDSLQQTDCALDIQEWLHNRNGLIYAQLVFTLLFLLRLRHSLSCLHLQLPDSALAMNHYHSHLKTEVFWSQPSLCLLLFSLINLYWLYLARPLLLHPLDCSLSARVNMGHQVYLGYVSVLPFCLSALFFLRPALLNIANLVLPTLMASLQLPAQPSLSPKRD